MRKMHLKRQRPLILPTPVGPQIRLTAAECFTGLLQASGSKNAPIGFYGFSAESLGHERDLPPKDTLMWQVARLQALAGSGLAHPLV